MWTALTLLALAALHGPVAPRLASNKLPVVAVHHAFPCRTRTPPRARTPRLSDDLAVRVLNTLLDDEEKPFVIWSETGPKPLKINLDLLNHRARVLERRGDTEAALETFEYCCSIDPNDGRAWLARARIRERAGVPEEAQRLLVEALEWEPENAYLLQAYGALQERRGKSDEALELYTAAVRASPKHAPAWVACGLLLEKRRKPEAAATCFLTASSVAPRSYFVWQVLGEWRKRRGELGSAREAYRRSLQLNQKNAATFHAWGVLEWRCGHHELATQLFRKGLEASPANRYILQSWACMEARSGRSEEAQKLFANATKRRGPRRTKNRPDGATWQARALQCLKEGKVREARACLERGVAIEPMHVPLYHAWGQLELEQNNVTAARDIYQRGVWASRNERETTSLWTAWALLEERAGDAESARAYLREALERDRFAVDVRISWGNFEARAGDLAAARQLFEGAVRIDPTNAEVWAAYEEMERAHSGNIMAARVFDRAEGAMTQALPPPRAEPLSLPTKALQAAAQEAQAWSRAAVAAAAQRQVAQAQEEEQKAVAQRRGYGVETRPRSALEAAYGEEVAKKSKRRS